MSIGMRIALALGVAGTAAIAFTTFERPPVATAQLGYRGLGMTAVENPRTVETLRTANQLPEVIPADDPSGQKASELFSNVKVLGDLDANEFLRVMGAITEWVAPEQGCAYCHLESDLASDAPYAKVVSRRMLQMTRSINAGWTSHVGETGVTCYTCHRGKPVPGDIWFHEPQQTAGSVGNRAGQNAPEPKLGLSALPTAAFGSMLQASSDVRVVSATALPEGNPRNIKETEVTYGLMMHISQSLGVNCTFCHNSRSFSAWDQSSPQRSTAWYGIRMVRDLNANYLEPLTASFPHERLGPTGDAPKLNCATCHQGANKPMFGASLLSSYPVLRGPATPSR